MDCKDDSVQQNRPAYEDLIETLWNVKIMTVDGSNRYGLGFNRDIVECTVVCTPVAGIEAVSI